VQRQHEDSPWLHRRPPASARPGSVRRRIGFRAAQLLIANRPLGFVAIPGVIALVGMIARNAVILIDQPEKEAVTA
jgi:hypothetical protein